MKIISNRKYNALYSEITLLNKEIDNAEKIFKEYNININNLMIDNAHLNSENIKLKDKIKKLNSSKGGLIKQINKLEKTLEETKKKLEESMTDKYLVKKIPIGRLPKSQVMKLRTHEKQDKIVQKIYDKLERE